MTHAEEARVHLRLRAVHLDGELGIAAARCCGRCDEVDEDSADHADIWNEAETAATHLSELDEQGTIKRVAQAKGGEVPLVPHWDARQGHDRAAGARLDRLGTIC